MSRSTSAAIKKVTPTIRDTEDIGWGTFKIRGLEYFLKESLSYLPLTKLSR